MSQGIPLNTLPAPFLVRGASIYAIINSENGKIYIGSSVHTKHRWSEHRSELFHKCHGNRYLQRAYNKNPNSLMIELIEQIANPTKELVLKKEQFWMDFYKSHDSNFGYNISPKADSCLGIKRTPEQRQKMMGRKRKTPLTDQQRKNLSDALKGHAGRMWTQEQREAARKRATGRKKSKETKEKHSMAILGKTYPWARKICQYSADGNFIRTHRSAIDAGKFMRGILKSGEDGIRYACKFKLKAGGFAWRYFDEVKEAPQIQIKPNPKKKRPVIQMDANGKIIETFGSAHEAFKKTGVYHAAIAQVCKNPKWRAGGFYWRFV